LDGDSTTSRKSLARDAVAALRNAIERMLKHFLVLWNCPNKTDTSNEKIVFSPRRFT
jgi:hypothetical protein